MTNDDWRVALADAVGELLDLQLTGLGYTVVVDKYGVLVRTTPGELAVIRIAVLVDALRVQSLWVLSAATVTVDEAICRYQDPGSIDPVADVVRTLLRRYEREVRAEMAL